MVQRAFGPGYCTPRWLPAVFNEAVFSGVSMAAEKTFSRINAGKSMLFLGRLTRCAQYPRPKGAPTSGRNYPGLDELRPERAAELQRIGCLTLYF